MYNIIYYVDKTLKKIPDINESLLRTRWFPKSDPDK